MTLTAKALLEAVRHRKYVLVVIPVVLLTVAGVLYAFIGENAPDEWQRIDNAAKAPFADFERGHAHQFCDDFIPAVAGGLARNLSSAADCQTRVAHAFALIGGGRESGASKAPILRAEVTGIVWHGDDARATVSYAGVRSGQVWAFEKIDNIWRISTPTTLEATTNCLRAVRGDICENGVSNVWLDIHGLKRSKFTREKPSSASNESK